MTSRDPGENPFRRRPPAPAAGPPAGPEALGEVLARLFAARGWGRRQERLKLEQAWADAAGPELAGLSRVEGFRRGVLEVTVANTVLVQEIVQFRKRRLLEALRTRLSNLTVTDLRVRAGAVGPDGQLRS